MCQVLWSLGYLSLWQPQMLQSLGTLGPGSPSCGEAGDGAGRNRVGWLVCRNIKAAFAAGCLGSSSAAKRLWLFPLSRFASAGEGQLSPWSGRVPEWCHQRLLPWATSAESALDVLPAGCVGPHGQGVEGTLNWRGCALRGLCTWSWQQRVLLWVTGILLRAVMGWNPCQGCLWGPWAYLAPAGHK